MRADGMTCCLRHIPVVTVGLGRLVKNIGKRGGNIHLPPLSYDRHPIASTGGFEMGNLNWEIGVHCWSVPRPEDSWHYSGVEAPLCRQWLSSISEWNVTLSIEQTKTARLTDCLT